MLRKTLSKIFSSKIFFVIFALLAAVALWLYVEITENEQHTIRIPDVPIVWTNEALLRDRGLLITNHEPQSVVLTFEVPLSIAARLNNANVSVAVDLANITRQGNITESFRINLPSDVDENAISEITRSVEMISLVIDSLGARSIPVRVEYTGGTASDDLIAEPAEFEPASITVSGPEVVISRINHAVVPILRENLALTYVDDLHFYLIDEYGYELDEETMELVSSDIETIRVTIPIVQIKEVPLFVNLSHGAGSTDQNTIWTTVPPFITVSGDPEALREFNVIELPTIDMTSFSQIGTQQLPIIVPPHIRNDSGETFVTVRVEVRELDVRDFAVSNLFYVNRPPGHSVEMISASIDVRLRGKNEDLADITAMDIRVVADLEDFAAGRHRVISRVYIDGTDAYVGPIGETRMALRIVSDTE